MSKSTKQERGEYYRQQANNYLQEGHNRAQAHSKALDDCRDKFDVSDRTLRRSTADYRDGKKAYPEMPADSVDESNDNNHNTVDAASDGELPTLDDVEDKFAMEDDYHYDEEAGVYLIPMSTMGKVLKLDEEEVKRIKRLYSNWDGNPDTINQICQKTGFPRNQFIELKSKLGMTHDQEPFTKEEVLNKNMEQMIDNLHQQRRNRLAEEWESEKLKAMQKDADKWQELKQGQLDPLRDALSDISVPTPNDSPTYEQLTDHTRAAVIPLQDLHFGERGRDCNWTLDKMEERFTKTTRRLLHRIEETGDHTKIIIGVMGDIFHVDTESETTTRGTNVDASASVRKIYRRGSQCIADFIETCRQLAPTEVACVDGNHDRVTSFALMDKLEAMYDGQEGIEFTEGPHDLKFTKFGDNLLAISHGDRYRNSDKSKIFAREAATLWGKTNHRYWMQGHTHGEEIRSDKTGVQRLTGMSIAPQSSFEREKGYPHQAGMVSYVLDRQEGKIHTPSVRINE